MRGSAGAEWLAGLPGLVDEFERRWSLRLGELPGDLWFNYVTHATLPDGAPAVLKLCLPREREFRTEVHALRR